MDTNTTYSLEFSIQNFKSYYGDEITLEFNKPITVIAGPNGEGKSNLLEALSLCVYHYLNHARKFKDIGLFNKEIEILSEPKITASFGQLLFQDLEKKALHPRPREIEYPERLLSSAVLTRNTREGYIGFKINRSKGNRTKLLAESLTRFGKRYDGYSHVIADYQNNIEYLDLIYLTPDSNILDFFIKLVIAEWQSQLNHIGGGLRTANYIARIFSCFPFTGSRLLNDIDPNGFQESYETDSGMFLTSNLATGAKKEGILYLLGLLKERANKYKDWMAVIIIDELETGLHVMRQKYLVDAIIHIFTKYPELRGHIKIILSTHSPLVYSEFGKHDNIVDVLYVLRNPNEPTHVYKSNDNVSDKLIDKRLLSELGLNIFELPEKILFVEGKTDKYFINNIYDNIAIYSLDGASLPNILKQFLLTLPLARMKYYRVLVDKNKEQAMSNMINDFKASNTSSDINIDSEAHDYNTIEEFILGINIDEHSSPSRTWGLIEARFGEIDEYLESIGAAKLGINVSEPRSRMGTKQGIVNFLDTLKNKTELYEICGKHWRSILCDSEIAFLKSYKRTNNLTYQRN